MLYFCILLHCVNDLGVIIRLGATTVYTEGPLLEGTFFVISHYMFRPNCLSINNLLYKRQLHLDGLEPLSQVKM
jgi:hypothetical protein